MFCPLPKSKNGLQNWWMLRAWIPVMHTRNCFNKPGNIFAYQISKDTFQNCCFLIFCIPQIVTDLFELNLRQVAKKFGLLDIAVPELSGNDAARILNLAEEYSFEPSDEDRLLSLILCALVWKTEKKNGLHLNHLSEEY